MQIATPCVVLSENIKPLTIHLLLNSHLKPPFRTNTNITPRAGLEDGTVITGQNSISHPSAPSAPPPVPALTVPPTPNIPGTPTAEPEEPISPTTRTSLDLYNHDHIEDANLPGSLPSLRRPNITFAKSHNEDLPSRIERYATTFIQPFSINGVQSYRNFFRSVAYDDTFSLARQAPLSSVCSKPKRSADT